MVEPAEPTRVWPEDRIPEQEVRGPVCIALRFRSMAAAREVIAGIQRLVDDPAGVRYRDGEMEAGVYPGALGPAPLLWFTPGAVAAARSNDLSLPEALEARRIDRRRQTSLVSIRRAAPRPAAGTGPDRRRVLIVDDDHDVAWSLAALVELWGCRVEVAATGDEACVRAGDFHPHVVLLDLVLPDCHGYHVAERLRRETEGLPPSFVAVTGWSIDQALSRDAGIATHLQKPVDPDALHRILDAHWAHD